MTTESRQTILDASGDGTIIFGPVPSGYRWRIGRIAIDTSGAATPNVTAFVNSIASTSIVDFSPAQRRNIADEATAIDLEQGETLIMQWDAADALAVASARIQYEQQSPAVQSAIEEQQTPKRKPAMVTAGYGDDGLLPRW